METENHSGTSALEECNSTIKEFLEAMGLTEEDIRILQEGIGVDGHRRFRLKARVGQIRVHHLPPVGRAIARVKDIKFLDAEERKPLTIWENAFLFCHYQLEKYVMEKGNTESPKV